MQIVYYPMWDRAVECYVSTTNDPIDKGLYTVYPKEDSSPWPFKTSPAKGERSKFYETEREALSKVLKDLELAKEHQEKDGGLGEPLKKLIEKITAELQV